MNVPIITLQIADLHFKGEVTLNALSVILGVPSEALREALDAARGDGQQGQTAHYYAYSYDDGSWLNTIGAVSLGGGLMVTSPEANPTFTYSPSELPEFLGYVPNMTYDKLALDDEKRASVHGS